MRISCNNLLVALGFSAISRRGSGLCLGFALLLCGCARAGIDGGSAAASLASPDATAAAADAVDACWSERAAHPDVLMATNFATEKEVSGWVHANKRADHVSRERVNWLSGGGSLRFEILQTDKADAGNWRRWLSDDKREFGEGDELFVQFRQYIPEYLASHVFKGGGGWKQAIISRRDSDMGPGRAGSNQLNEIVLQNTQHRGIVQGYNRDLKSGYPPWEVPAKTACSPTDFLLQNGIGGDKLNGSCLSVRRANGGLYSYYRSKPDGYRRGFPDPESLAFAYWPDEWVTYMVRLRIGTYGQRDHEVQVWGAREGARRFTLIHDHRALALGMGPPHDTLWLLPYNTGRKPDPDRQATYTLYDEVIVSTSMIALPAAACP